MPICFDYLIDGVADKFGYDHEVGAKVDQHGYKRMTEVMNAYWPHFCFCTIVSEYASKCIIGNGMFAAEEERGITFIIFQFFLHDPANRCFLFLFCFCRCNFVRSSAECFPRYRLIEYNAAGLYIIWCKSKDFTFSAASKKQQGKKCMVQRIVYNGDKFFKIFARPYLHLCFLHALFWLGDLGEIVLYSVAAFTPTEKGLEKARTLDRYL